MAATITRLSYEHRPWTWSLEFDFSPEMVDALKRCVPSRQRTWKPDLRQWWFQDTARETVLALALAYCPPLEHREPEQEEPAMPDDLAAAYRSLHLLPSAPDPLVKAAYRTLAKLHHPDKGGGSTAEMQRLNSAYAKLTTERG